MYRINDKRSDFVRVGGRRHRNLQVAPFVSERRFKVMNSDEHALRSAKRGLLKTENPEYPLGQMLRESFLRLDVVDEYYRDFVTAPDAASGLRLMPHYSNLLVLKSFSKAAGLAGLWIGYALSSPDVAEPSSHGYRTLCHQLDRSSGSARLVGSSRTIRRRVSRYSDSFRTRACSP
ncbi:aminotransferase class I/II-fold pyridoxal phosphate-dependent enzyme [Rhodococcus sp. (in: high G+C Gram-positive bacteria)]|uniref:aminotransferase class I/II-fold pyridoxal phosphate-dependent enzyme n=1 Tax=Rhodococcus sp. TaxID=1831 RepID=UPI000975888F|nr:aminotransferase class I/II-fold pyridoxal phosphate-dependent enzyme [Rhodococcus sp. (in: high G+C Gram-positive bacteria)]